MAIVDLHQKKCSFSKFAEELAVCLQIKQDEEPAKKTAAKDQQPCIHTKCNHPIYKPETLWKSKHGNTIGHFKQRSSLEMNTIRHFNCWRPRNKACSSNNPRSGWDARRIYANAGFNFNGSKNQPYNYSNGFKRDLYQLSEEANELLFGLKIIADSSYYPLIKTLTFAPSMGIKTQGTMVETLMSLLPKNGDLKRSQMTKRHKITFNSKKVLHETCYRIVPFTTSTLDKWAQMHLTHGWHMT